MEDITLTNGQTALVFTCVFVPFYFIMVGVAWAMSGNWLQSFGIVTAIYTGVAILIAAVFLVITWASTVPV